MLTDRRLLKMGEIGATNMYMEWKLFDKIPVGSSISYKELADSIGAEEAIVCKSTNSPLCSHGRIPTTGRNTDEKNKPASAAC